MSKEHNYCYIKPVCTSTKGTNLDCDVFRESRGLSQNKFYQSNIYTCLYCDISLPSYTTWNYASEYHVYKDSVLGRNCEYIRSIFAGREHELRVLRGALRFKRGLFAFYEDVLEGCDGYLDIWGKRFCLVCATPKSEQHSSMCDVVQTRLSVYLTNTRMYIPCDPPMFDNNGHSWYGLPENIPTLTLFGGPNGSTSFPRDCTSSLQLGSEANMTFVKGTIDTYRCSDCNLKVNNFVKGDTLLGEHIFHTYNVGRTCPALERHFRNNLNEIPSVLGLERFRKGFVAFPVGVMLGVKGIVNGKCIVCGECLYFLTESQRYRPCRNVQCAEVRALLKRTLKYTLLS